MTTLRVPHQSNEKDLGMCIERDANLLEKAAWKVFVKMRSKRGNFANLDIQHPP